MCNSYTKRAIWPEDWWVFVWGSFFWRSEAYKSCISPKCLRWFEGGIMFKTYQYPWKEELCIKIIIVNYMYDKELICTNLRNKNSKNNNLIGHHEDSLEVIISAFPVFFTLNKQTTPILQYFFFLNVYVILPEIKFTLQLYHAIS